MEHQVYIPLEQPIEGLQNTSELIDNKYDLKSLMENSSIQNSTPEFIKMIDHNLIIDDDDMLFENFPENDANDIIEAEQKTILSAFQSALTGNQSNQPTSSTNSNSRNQVSLPNVKIVKGKMYEIEEPFFRDFDDLLPPQPPAYDDHIETIQGSLHRPILPIDTLFPTDDMMYQNGSLVMQNGEKYAITNYVHKPGIQKQKVNDSDLDSSPKPQIIPPLLVSPQKVQYIAPAIAESVQLQDNKIPSTNLQKTQSSSAIPISLPQPQNISPYVSLAQQQSNNSPFLINPQQSSDASPYVDITPQNTSQLRMNEPELGKPLFDFNPPFQPPPFMPPSQLGEPSYRQMQGQPYVAPVKAQNDPAYRPTQKPSYPQIPDFVAEPIKPPPQAYLKPQQNQKQHNVQQQEADNNEIDQEAHNDTNKKKNSRKRAEAMPC